MGSGVSKPNRQLKNIITKTGNVKSSQPKVKLPSQKLKDQFEGTVPQGSDAPSYEQTQPNDSEMDAAPRGKDGMDPQADQGFIRMMNDLGKQIHSHNANHNQHIDVRALKQLLNRKQLHDQGQSEVKAQIDGSADRLARTMVHPRTLTAIVNALNDANYPHAEIARDYDISQEFLQNMSRFQVANKVVIIEEHRKDDEIGPKVSQPMARAATESSMIDYDGEMSEIVNEERIRNLKKRLE